MTSLLSRGGRGYFCMRLVSVAKVTVRHYKA